MTCAVSVHLYVIPGSHSYVKHHCKQKKLLQRASVVGKAVIPQSFFSLGHGCAQDGRSEWRGSYSNWYRRYLVSRIHDLPDAMAFAHEDSTLAGSRASVLLVKTVGGSEGANVDIEGSENENYENNDEKSSDLSDSNLESGGFYKMNENKVTRKSAVAMSVINVLVENVVPGSHRFCLVRTSL